MEQDTIYFHHTASFLYLYGVRSAWTGFSQDDHRTFGSKKGQRDSSTRHFAPKMVTSKREVKHILVPVVWSLVRTSQRKQENKFFSEERLNGFAAVGFFFVMEGYERRKRDASIDRRCPLFCLKYNPHYKCSYLVVQVFLSIHYLCLFGSSTTLLASSAFLLSLFFTLAIRYIYRRSTHTLAARMTPPRCSTYRSRPPVLLFITY